MFIAHLPAGYLAATCVRKWAEPFVSRATARQLFVAFLVGSVFPDIDMIYFYFIDHGQHLHHHYWTHLPIFWVACTAAALLITTLIKRLAWRWIAIGFFGGVILHLLLDTPMGGIRWLYPLSPHEFRFVTVPATHSWWILSFVCHWTFWIAITICAAAGLLLASDKSRAA